MEGNRFLEATFLLNIQCHHVLCAVTKSAVGEDGAPVSPECQTSELERLNDGDGTSRHRSPPHSLIAVEPSLLVLPLSSFFCFTFE